MVTDDEEAARRFVEAVPRAAVAGTPARIAETVTRWAAAGVDEVIVPDFVLGWGAERLDALDALIAAFTAVL
jgi:alkanesulfonate monooxygenase SsuD/methylene tetrahydromethanopterin reductase-like flavin-dependent oxidoreductase (luciferase family)